MSRRKAGTALAQAIDFLTCEAETLKARGESRFPSLRALARRERFSLATLQEALGRLTVDGTLVVVRRGGVFIGGASARCPEIESVGRSSPRWRLLATQINESILTSELDAASPLPSSKTLCSRYGVSPPTLAKALDSLVTAGRLTRRERRFSPARPSPDLSTARLVLLTQLPSRTALARYNARSSEFWSVLQQECLRLRLRFEIVHADTFQVWKPDARSDSSVLGYIVLTLGMGHKEENLRQLISQAVSSGKPVSVLDDDGVIALERIAAMVPGGDVRCFGMGVTPVGGEIVGQYLLAHGHRRAAVFSLVDSSPWCLARATGIERAYESAGMKGAVRRFTLTRFDSLEAVSREIDGREPYLTFKRRIDEFHSALAPQLAQRVQSFYNVGFDFYLWVHFMVGELEPLFERALADTSLSAWVGVSDMVAFLAMDFLERRGVRLPGRLSLVGFDDLPEAFSAGLTSYNFNVFSTVRAMIDHVVERHPRRGVRCVAPQEIRGRVMERASSGPARPYHQPPV